MSYLNGMDVSLYQGDITNVLAGQAFCIVKVSQSSYADPKAPSHFASCQKAGVAIGAYHWLDPQPDAVTQARIFLTNAGPASFLAVDVEGRILRSPARAYQMAREFIAYVHANDQRKVLIYSSRGTWPWGENFGQDGNWVADYSGDPNRPGARPRVAWSIWQWKGIGVDRDYCNAATLAALTGKPAASTPTPEAEPMLNLVPLTAHRVIDIPAGTVLTKTPGGDQYTKLPSIATLGFLGATNTHYCVADGDAGVYVDRATKGLVVRTADINAGV